MLMKHETGPNAVNVGGNYTHKLIGAALVLGLIILEL
jgi:hypothetical protein